MGDLSIFEAIIIAIVEGLTEFLPVSSTGHMIITQNVLGVESTELSRHLRLSYSLVPSCRWFACTGSVSSV